MKSQLYGIIGIAIGIIAFLSGLGMSSGGTRSEFGGLLLIGGIFLFGCGLVAAAVGAKK